MVVVHTLTFESCSLVGVVHVQHGYGAHTTIYLNVVDVVHFEHGFGAHPTPYF
jgi:hypothetical protein